MPRHFAAALFAIFLLALPARAAEPDPSPLGRGAVRGARSRRSTSTPGAAAKRSTPIIDWAAGELDRRYGIKLVQVKLDDTANAVGRVVAEKAAGKDSGGSVDLIWINGENFAAMKKQGLLFSPGWAEKLPNFAYVDAAEKPTMRTDFTVPVDGLESPWGMAKLVFFYDEARTPAATLPRSAKALLDWAKANPGRFTYPQPPDFTGSSFLKQVLVELVDDPSALARPVEEATFQRRRGRCSTISTRSTR